MRGAQIAELIGSMLTLMPSEGRECRPSEIGRDYNSSEQG